MAFEPYLLLDLEHIRAVIAFAEEAIAREQRRTQDAIDAARPRIQDVALAALEGDPRLPEGLFNSGLTFPTILRRSLMIAICSHTEHTLREWCGFLHSEWRLSRTLRETPKTFRQSDIDHCMTYVRDVGGLPLVDFASWPEWQMVDRYRVVRNLLAHNGGDVADPRDQLRIAGLPDISLDDAMLLLPWPTIRLEPGACEAAVDAAKLLFGRLSAIVQQDPRARLAPQIAEVLT